MQNIEQVTYFLEDYIRKFPHQKEALTDPGGDYTDQADSLLDILAIDVAYYTMRRTLFCGSVADHLRDVRRVLIKKYEKHYGVFEDPNTEVDW